MTLAAYAVTATVPIILVVWLGQLWHADLSVPFQYQFDALFSEMVVKSTIENGWYLHNPRLGAPLGLDLHDFPMADSLHIVLIKLVSLFAGDFGKTINMFFLLTFPLVALSSLYMLRQFGMSYPPAMMGSWLYAFLNYHWFRGETHLFLTCYYLVPPMVMVTMWVFQENDLLFHRNEKTGKLCFRLSDRKSIVSLVVCVLVSAAGIYYAFFGCFFLLLAGILAATWQRRIHSLFAAIILIVSIALGVVLNISPTLAYQRHNGKNAGAVVRPPIAGEVYSLRIAQMLLPISDHRFGFLRGHRESYTQHQLFINENDAAALGSIMSLGFIILILYAFALGRAPVGSNLIHPLSSLNLGAVLLATMGGFGPLICFLWFPYIRAYNRISVYIAFFCMFAIVIVCDRLARKFGRTRSKRVVITCGIFALAAAGILDQFPNRSIVTPPAFEAEYRSDAEFMAQIEAMLPEGAMIFQFPYMAFPESPPVGRIGSYQLLKGYLHSKNLRWSYGGVKGRQGDLWQRTILMRPLDQVVAILSRTGFSGILIDRYGYADDGSAIMAELSEMLHFNPLISRNKRLAFFCLARRTPSLPRARL